MDLLNLKWIRKQTILSVIVYYGTSILTVHSASFPTVKHRICGGLLMHLRLCLSVFLLHLHVHVTYALFLWYIYVHALCACTYVHIVMYIYIYLSHLLSTCSLSKYASSASCTVSDVLPYIINCCWIAISCSRVAHIPTNIEHQFFVSVY